MAVQVQVKGQDLDFVLMGADARHERIFHGEDEMLTIVDVDNKPLYLVPIKNIRLIQPVSETEYPIPRHVGNQAVMMIHIKGDQDGEFNLRGIRIDYSKPVNTLMANVYDISSNGEKQVYVGGIPFENIRYIDMNFLGQPLNDEPKVEDTPPVEEKGEKEKPSAPVFKHKPVKN